MKTISIICTLFLTVYGFYEMMTGNLAGFVPFIIGPIAFLIIDNKAKKIPGYDKNHFMNR